MTRIEYYVCPLCGKTTPLKSFNPQVDLNTLGFIQIREGGGRGSGFRVTEEHSLKSVASQYPKVLKKIRERVDWLKDLLQPGPKEIAQEQILSEIEKLIYSKIWGADPEEVMERIRKLFGS